MEVSAQELRSHRVLRQARIDIAAATMTSRFDRLMRRVKELSVENEDLRALCTRNGIPYEEWLAARRHRRYFVGLCESHPCDFTATGEDALCALSHKLGVYPGTVASMLIVSRKLLNCFYGSDITKT